MQEDGGGWWPVNVQQYAILVTGTRFRTSCSRAGRELFEERGGAGVTGGASVTGGHGSATAGQDANLITGVNQDPLQAGKT